MRSRLFRLGCPAVGLLLVALAGFAYHRSSQGCEVHFEERRGRLASATEDWSRSLPSHTLQAVELLSSSGLRAEMYVRVPKPEPAEPGPLLLILGGLRTGRGAVELVPNPGDVTLAAIDYPYRGSEDLRGVEIAAALPEIRGALLDTPPALSLALDHLLTLPTVDPKRVELVGVSLGAPLVTVAGALDPRFQRVWAVHGGGRLREMIDFNLRDELPGLLRPVAAAFGGLLVAPLSPERYAGRIAPRPFVLINAEQDDRIPRVCVTSLFQAARQPKEQIWVEGGHVRPRATEQIRQLVELVLSRLEDLA